MALDGNTIPYVPPAATPQQQIAAINRVIDIINSFQQQIVFADGTTKRMLIGYQKDGWGEGKDFGIKISIDGVNVYDATEDQLLFKMDLDTWFYYDKTTKKNFMQIGQLPDESYGWVVSAEGSDVKDIYA